MKSNLIGQQVGEFVVLEPLGSGGSAEVFRSIQPALQRTVAIKFLRDENNHNRLCLRRFRREAIVTSWIGHPLAIQVYASGQHDGCMWIAMEFVDGQNLKDWIREHGPIPLAELMKKPLKLALRKETVRVLVVSLAQIAGGIVPNQPNVFPSQTRTCPAPDVSGDK